MTHGQQKQKTRSGIKRPPMIIETDHRRLNQQCSPFFKPKSFESFKGKFSGNVINQGITDMKIIIYESILAPFNVLDTQFFLILNPRHRVP